MTELHTLHSSAEKWTICYENVQFNFCLYFYVSVIFLRSTYLL